MGNATQWLWEKAFTQPGFYTIGAIAIVASTYVAISQNNYWLGILYLPFAAIGTGFAILLSGLIGFTGDIFSRWLIHKIFSPPNPVSFGHQAAYFVASLAGFLLAAAFILPNFVGSK